MSLCACFQPSCGASQPDIFAMTYRLPILLLVAALGVVPTMPADVLAGQRANAAALEPIGLEVAWRGQAVMNPRRDKLAHFSNDVEVVYAQSSAGVVSVFNAETGRRLWARQVGQTDEVSMQAVSNSDIVLVVAGPVGWGLDKFTGEVLFEQRLRHHPSAAPAIDSGSCYFPLADGSVHAYAIQTLKYLERYSELPPGVAQPHLWRFNLNEKIRLPVVATEKVLVFGTKHDNLYSISPAGSTYYQQFLNAGTTAPICIDNHGDRQTIVVATADGNLYGFDLTRGTSEWLVPLERNVYEQPLALDGRVYFVMRSAGLGAVSTATGRYVDIADEVSGERRWFVPGVTSILGIAQDAIYGLDGNNRVVAIDKETARVIDRVSVGRYSKGIRNAVTDRLLLASAAGELICLKPAGSRFATFHQRPENEPLEVDIPATDTDVAPEADDAAEDTDEIPQPE